MDKKILGILVSMLVISSTVLSVSGTINIQNNKKNSNVGSSNGEEIHEKRAIWYDEDTNEPLDFPIIEEVTSTDGFSSSEDQKSAYEELRKKVLEDYLEATREHREAPVKSIMTFEPYPNGYRNGKIKGSLGYQEFTNPWPYGWTWKSHGTCVATINTNTGEGRAYAYPIPNTETRAQCGVENCPEGYGIVYPYDDTDAAAILKAPSDIAGDMLNLGEAFACVMVEVREYHPQTGELTRSWSDDIYWITKTGSFYKNLDNLGIDFEVLHNYLYVIGTWASAYAHEGSSPSQGALCDIDPVRFKKLRWYWDEGDYDIELTSPHEGKLYFGFSYKEYPFTFPWSYALVLFCREMKFEAYDYGTGVESVKFVADDEICRDHSSADGYFSCTMSPGRGIYQVYAYAYDSEENLVAEDSVKIYKFPL